MGANCTLASVSSNKHIILLCMQKELYEYTFFTKKGVEINKLWYDIKFVCSWSSYHVICIAFLVCLHPKACNLQPLMYFLCFWLGMSDLFLYKSFTPYSPEMNFLKLPLLNIRLPPSLPACFTRFRYYSFYQRKCLPTYVCVDQNWKVPSIWKREDKRSTNASTL